MKIQKTNRIRLRNMTIYCSYKIVQEVRHHCERLNQVLVPKKGEMEELIHDLAKLAKKMPDQFPNTSRDYLIGRL